jgi:uncharacterized cofD-like protein
MKTLRIVGIGGGTGLPVVLRGLAREPFVDVSAIVTVADNGGSSGRLREGLGLPAVGDLRNCLVALAEHDSALAELFQYRFVAGDVEGHSLGNLIVAALYQRTGRLTTALEIARQLLPSKGRAFAATEVPATLCAAFRDGTTTRGESEISAAGRSIERVWLEPNNPEPSPGVLEAIYTADAVILGPGSLYTSLLPNLLVARVANAIRESSAIKILICNLMTQPGETDGFTASDHLRIVQSYLGPVVDFCVVNSAVEPAGGPSYQITGSQVVRYDIDEILSLGAIPIEEDLLTVQGEKIRHNVAKLGRLIVGIVDGHAQRCNASRAVLGVEGEPVCLDHYVNA